MLKLSDYKKEKNRGFTLVELIVTIVLFSIVAIASLGILSATMTTRGEIESRLRDQVALRQAIVSITKDIREDPEVTPPETLQDRYDWRDGYDGVLFRIDESGNYAGAVAENLSEFSIDTDNDRGQAVITLKSQGGQEVTTTIYLRI